MDVLYTDRGQNFISEAMLEVCKVLGIQKRQTVSYNLQGNGVVEKLNATLINNLSHLVEKNQADWCQRLPLALFSHRTSRHSALSDSLAFVTYGRDLRTPSDLLLNSPIRSYSDVQTYSQVLSNRLYSVYGNIKENLENAAKRQEEISNAKRSFKNIALGNLVYLHSEVIPVGLLKKLVKQNVGPYRVISQKSPVLFEIAPT
ncbi:uncharacterized protein LOC129231177 [Uloborus diversus]|uniref:uncharacterized protein LOC129231177 n=1 Tax=Uloborus diversus TaxID=327109 RepID=UPI002409AF06|nr:uncharacterized protein LOC129231177 [Uloborus diversus]